MVFDANRFESDSKPMSVELVDKAEEHCSIERKGRGGAFVPSKQAALDFGLHLVEHGDHLLADLRRNFTVERALGQHRLGITDAQRLKMLRRD